MKSTPIECLTSSPISRFAQQILVERISTAMYWLPLAADHAAYCSDYVHQLRVASRRANAALRLMESLVAKRRGQTWRRRLRRIRRAAGDAREMDVLIMRLEEEHGQGGPPRDASIGALQQWLRVRRAQAQRMLRQESERLNWDAVWRDLRKLSASVRWRSRGPEPDWREALERKLDAEWPAFAMKARSLLARPASRDSKSAPRPSQFHAFRVLAKRLRYGLELAGQDQAGPLLSALSTIQDRLGRMNDHATALQQWESGMGDTRAAALRDTLQERASQERNALNLEMARFQRWWTAERFQALNRQWRTTLKQLRRRANPTSPPPCLA
ncbi:MAG TPA: CHAD domain-containing protein [Pirellulaceae bacterium]